MNGRFRIYTHKLKNKTSRTIKILSGEYPQINNVNLERGQYLNIALVIPEGFKPYSVEYMGPNNTLTKYVGYIHEDV